MSAFALANLEAVLSDATNESEGPPRKKRKRTATVIVGKPRGKKKGLLSELLDMPIDILFEVFGHLFPADLSQLARTSKATRSLLMHRSSTSVWKSARGNLPDEFYLEIPDDMSEPMYAHLLFDSYCDFCLTARVKNPLWAWRVRCCKKCLPENFFTRFCMSWNKLDPSGGTERVFGCLPQVSHPTTRFCVYYNPAISEFLCAVEEAKLAGTLEEFFEERTVAAKRLDERAEEEEAIAQAREDFRGGELASIKEQRRIAIKQKLCELGWEDEFDRMKPTDDSFQKNVHVKQPKLLTDRIWKNIEAPMVEFISQVKAGRLIVERQAPLVPLLRIWRCWHNPKNILPSDADIVHMTPFRNVIEDNTTILVTASSYSSAMSVLTKLCMHWRKSRAEYLLTLLPPELSTQLGNLRLTLATTAFYCTRCQSVITYPRILSHRCMHLSAGNIPHVERYDSFRGGSFKFPWNNFGDRIAYSEDHEKCVSMILQSVGKDVKTTTVWEMDACNIRWVCNCETHTRYLNWRMAYQHLAYGKYVDGFEHSWQIWNGDSEIIDNFIIQVVSDSNDKPATSKGPRDAYSRCRSCDEFLFPSGRQEIINHWTTRHGINITPNQHLVQFCYRDLDRSPLSTDWIDLPKWLLEARKQWVGNCSEAQIKQWNELFEKHPEWTALRKLQVTLGKGDGCDVDNLDGGLEIM